MKIAKISRSGVREASRENDDPPHLPYSLLLLVVRMFSPRRARGMQVVVNTSPQEEGHRACRPRSRQARIGGGAESDVRPEARVDEGVGRELQVQGRGNGWPRLHWDESRGGRPQAPQAGRKNGEVKIGGKVGSTPCLRPDTPGLAHAGRRA